MGTAHLQPHGEQDKQDKETVRAEEREQLRDEFRQEELEYNEHLAEKPDALKRAVDERMAEYRDKHGDINR